MKAIMVMYDSLNCAYLAPYGGHHTDTPNFTRLAEHAVTFDNSFVCSLPCMPARRELHTGRCNFFHRSWGPIEPYDDSMPELLDRAGIHSHLVSDHGHYWEDGGATYHTRYSTWEISRGQEGDPWISNLTDCPERLSVFDVKKNAPLSRIERQDALNRLSMQEKASTPISKTFMGGLDFINNNHSADNWLLQIETFDPHEPFYITPQERTNPDGKNDDWPPYARVSEDDETVKRVRGVYSALVKKCDDYLGQVLDLMDKYDLWQDTMLIVNTDHGFLLGEHGWWGKTVMPVYDEIAHTPLFIYDPRAKDLVGVRRSSLVQTIDLAPTLLEFFGVQIPADMRGQPLCNVMASDAPIRDCAVFGYHSSTLNITDGRMVYMLSAAHPDEPTYEYTLMPTHMRRMFSPQEMSRATLAKPFDFTKNCPLMRIPTADFMGDTTSFGTQLFDLERDPNQEKPYRDEQAEAYFKSKLYDFLKDNDAPDELYRRFELQKGTKL